MYVMLFRFLIVTILVMTVQQSIAVNANNAKGRLNSIPTSLTITDDFRDDDGNLVIGAIAGSATRSDMDRNYDAFTKALNSLKYNEIIIPAGRFYFRNQLKITHKADGTLLPKKIIRGSSLTTSIYLPRIKYQLNCTTTNQIDCPATILDFSGIPDTYGQNPLFWLCGNSELLEASLTGNLVHGATSYNLSLGTAVRSGDLLILTDKNDNSYGPREGYHKGELLKVKAVEGRKITFDAVHDDYLADRCAIYKITPLQIELENITLIDTRSKLPHRNSDGNIVRYSSGEIVIRRAGAGLKVDHCENSKINNVYVLDAAYNAGISLNNLYEVDVESCNVVMALPDETRMVRSASGYSDWSPVDAYGIMIADSQNVRIRNADSRSWAHAIATGSGGSGMTPIVNRNIRISNSTFIATPAPLYWQNETAISALRKVSPANFHANIEDSIYENNLLIGAGFNIGGHNNSFINNEIWTDNYDEYLKLPLYHVDSAFYFDEAKSGQFQILNNRVHIRKYYQNPSQNANQHETNQFRFGEFVQFNYGGNILRTKISKVSSYGFVGKIYESKDAYTYELAGKIYQEGTLEIAGNEVMVHCFPGEDDQEVDYKTSMVSIGGLGADRYLKEYLANPDNPHVPEIQEALRTKMKLDVKIHNNSLIVHNNPGNSKMLMAFNSVHPGCLFWSPIRNITINDNQFEGVFRFTVNAGDVFEDGLSDNVIVKDNKFILSDMVDEATLLNTPNRVFAKTRNSVIENNIIRRR